MRLVLQAKVVPNPSETGKLTLDIVSSCTYKYIDSKLQSTVVWANVELNVGFVVAVMAPIRQLFQLIAAGGKAGEETTTNRSRSRTATFVDRSLIRIKDVDEEQLVIQDVGNLCGTTLATSSSRGTTKRHGGDDVELSHLGIINDGKAQK